MTWNFFCKSRVLVRVRNPRDNNSGACPEVLKVMEECNREHAAGYGDDEWTRRASDALREVFQTIFCVQWDGGEFARPANAASSIFVTGW